MDKLNLLKADMARMEKNIERLQKVHEANLGMFAKYMAHVIECEGDDYIDSVNSLFSFTEDEIKFLKFIDEGAELFRAETRAKKDKPN